MARRDVRGALARCSRGQASSYFLPACDRASHGCGEKKDQKALLQAISTCKKTKRPAGLVKYDGNVSIIIKPAKRAPIFSNFDGKPSGFVPQTAIKYWCSGQISKQAGGVYTAVQAGWSLKIG